MIDFCTCQLIRAHPYLSFLVNYIQSMENEQGLFCEEVNTMHDS